MNQNSKILTLEELAEIVAAQRVEGRRVTQCHGVFDVLHVGIIRHLVEAKKKGDILVVTITPDRYVNKGPDKPAFSEDLRAEAIAALDCVDYLAINRWPTAVETIRLLKPDFYVKGAEYREFSNDFTGSISFEGEAVKSVGGELIFTEDIVFGSARQINEQLQVLPKEACDFLSYFLTRHSSEDVLNYINGAAHLRVLVVGEAIIDEYHYCEGIGKSEKEPVLVARSVREEKYLGGTLAVANHIASFCDHVDLLTFLGGVLSHEEYIRKNLKPHIEPIFLYKHDSPTIVKRRFVDLHKFQKLFELYLINDEELNVEDNRAFCSRLKEILKSYDLVVVVDYGHGMITGDAVEILCRHSPFLAVNTQSNAGNKGYNVISKYERSDFVCLAMHEIALEVKKKRANLDDSILEVARRLSCDQVIATCGKYGSLGYRKQEGFSKVPVLSHKVIDTVGAGDAVLSLAALCAYQKAPMDILCFIGNATGAQAVTIVGNKEYIEKPKLCNYIRSLMK